MSIGIRGEADHAVRRIADAFRPYEEEHPRAEIVVYRQNPASIRVRIIDEDFDGISRADRHEILWKYIETLPEDVQSQMSILLALTPEETARSIANFDFENPIPSDF